MDTPTQAPANVPNCRRGITTALGSVVLAVAGLGFLGSSFGLLTVIFGLRTSAVPYPVLLINSVLSVLSKVGLLILGVFLIRRRPLVTSAATVGLAVSLIDSVYFIFAVVPPMRSRVDSALTGVFNFGAWIPAVLSALLYLCIFVYLGQPSSRREFGK